MTDNKKKPSGWRAGRPETERANGLNDTHIVPQTPRELQDHVSKLLAQADRQMINDRARYGQHFQIWLSLCFLKNGWPWDGAL